MIVELVFNIPVNNIFEYKVSDELTSQIKVGQRVKVEFNNRYATGIIIKIKDKPDFDIEKINYIKKILDIDPILNKDILKIGVWISKYYFEPIGETIFSTLPSSIKKFNIIKVKSVFVKPTVSKKTIEDMIKITSKHHVRILSVLYALLDIDTYTDTSLIFNKPSLFFSAIDSLDKKGILKKKVDIPDNIKTFNFHQEPDKKIHLTESQKKAIDTISHSVLKKEFQSYLIHGETGSGKTEVYLRLTALCLSEKKRVLIIVPEIALTPQTISRFEKRFPKNVAFFHSGMTNNEQFYQWNRIKNNEVSIALGVRSAVFAPLKNIGLIIVDEEHTNTYKQNNSPRYNARDVAVYRAKLLSCPVVLGSATPSLESYYNVIKRKYKLIEMAQRIGTFREPKIEIINLKETEFYSENRYFTMNLLNEIKNTIKQKKQVLLFHNRRGYSYNLMCKECGHRQICKHCSITLTYHKTTHRVKCHYCDYNEPPMQKCPECKSTNIVKIGIGTQRIEEVLKKYLPSANIVRIDTDTTRQRGYLNDVYTSFRKGDIDIIIGTQIISKGHDFQNIGLIAIVLAEQSMNIPDFRANERAFQLLYQMIGRAGRSQISSKVVVQTYIPDNIIIHTALKHDYLFFLKEELKFREMMNYPPYCYIVNIFLRAKKVNRLQELTYKINIINANIDTQKMFVEIIGPIPAMIEKIKDFYIYHIMIKGRKRNLLHNFLTKYIDKLNKIKPSGIRISVDVDPL